MLNRFLHMFVVRVTVALVVSAALLYFFVIRDTYYHASATARSAVGNAWMDIGFTVAIVWPPHTDKSLVEGVTLAVEELNASKSKLAGKLHLKFFAEPLGDYGGNELARQVVQEPDVLAVIGHEGSGSAIPASVTYEGHGILFLSPKNTDVRLTSHGFGYVFRLTPDDEVITRAMAAYALGQNWKKIGVLYGRNGHGESASSLIVGRAKDEGLETMFFRSYIEERDWVNQDFRPLVGELRREQFDAVMLADQLPWAAKMLVDMARMGLNQPVIATDKLDSLQVWQIAQIAANNLYVASSVNPESKEPAYLAFRQRFRARFNADPGYGASQGYEALKLFIDACARSHSADPVVLANTLRSVDTNDPWHGLFGDFTFAHNGNVIGRAVSIKKMFNGVFSTVDSITVETPPKDLDPMTPVVPTSPPAKETK